MRPLSLRQPPSTDFEKRLPEDKLGTSCEVTYNESDTLQDRKLLRKVDLR
jgi:hypothetical protein